jgi:hypothetical protein
MRPYTKTEVSERQLEELVRRHPGLIEEGLVYVTHQKPAAGGRLDVLMVDSGKSLVVAELKVTEDDGMLVQALDYYDRISTLVETYARAYKDLAIDPTGRVRLFLIAPSFSQTLVNRCKWLDLPISLFAFDCLQFEGDELPTPVYKELEIPPQPEAIELPSQSDILAYITDAVVRQNVAALMEEVKTWNPGSISQDPIQNAVSIKVNGRVFARLSPRHQHYLLGTFDAEEKWKEFPIKTDADLANVKPVARDAMERRAR